MNVKTKQNTVNIALAALFTAIIALCSQIAIPLPTHVSVTLQTFAVALCGYALGAKWGTASVAVYILLGVFGVPVFTGFKGGAQAIAGFTGGFIYGFILYVLLCGLAVKFKNKLLTAVLSLAGLAVLHILGTVHYALLSNISFFKAFLMVSAPFLIKDIVSMVLAYSVAFAFKKVLNKAPVHVQ